MSIGFGVSFCFPNGGCSSSRLVRHFARHEIAVSLEARVAVPFVLEIDLAGPNKGRMSKLSVANDEITIPSLFNNDVVLQEPPAITAVTPRANFVVLLHDDGTIESSASFCQCKT